MTVFLYDTFKLPHNSNSLCQCSHQTVSCISVLSMNISELRKVQQSITFIDLTKLLKSSPFKQIQIMKFKSLIISLYAFFKINGRKLSHLPRRKSIDHCNDSLNAEDGSISVFSETGACALKCIHSGERPNHILVPQRNKFVFRPVPK